MQTQATTRTRKATKRIINQFGGPTLMSKAVNVHRSTVSRWQIRGWIPESNEKRILAAAKKKRMAIQLADAYNRHLNK